ncbi:MAG TPA: uracil-DNA glycosylase family protein [Gemmatimonadaceae bacterium]|jgi:uracil-DNA glycosylase|nr:uracil-DNA glycosylase family protein [Gemmatimonadaceae bacterium]
MTVRQSKLESALADHCRALASCRKCGLEPDVLPIVSLSRRPDAMLVGQAPGKVEMGGGRAFAGRAGKTLFRWLERIGLDEATARDRIYIAAVTRCYPGPSSTGRGDRVPSIAERANCSSWLEEELRLIRPRLLIPVGRLAIERFLPRLPLEELIGREHEIEHSGGRSIAIPIPHPSGASSWIHQGDHPALLERALELIAARLAPLGLVRGRSRRSVA